MNSSEVQKYCGAGYKVVASCGHIRYLVKGIGAIDTYNNYEPEYSPIPNKRKVIAMLRREAKKASEVILASDLDREGEAIAYHTAVSLKLNPATTKRIIFNEISKKAGFD